MCNDLKECACGFCDSFAPHSEKNNSQILWLSFTSFANWPLLTDQRVHGIVSITSDRPAQTNIPKMHTFNETAAAGVPAFLAKLWRLVEDTDTNHLIYWQSVSVRTRTTGMEDSRNAFTNKSHQSRCLPFPSIYIYIYLL